MRQSVSGGYCWRERGHAGGLSENFRSLGNDGKLRGRGLGENARIKGVREQLDEDKMVGRAAAGAGF